MSASMLNSGFGPNSCSCALGAPAASYRRRPPQMRLLRPVFFVGFMGAGKTTVSRRLARLCGIASIDMDAYIERQVGKTISQIFEEAGESGFRDIETQVLHAIAGMDDALLVSCGGGVATREENRDILKDKGFVIHLMISADEAAGRISDISTRPLFNDIEAARARCEGRMPLYEAVADATVNVGGKTPAEVTRLVRFILQDAGVLVPAAGADADAVGAESGAASGTGAPDCADMGKDVG